MRLTTFLGNSAAFCTDDNTYVCNVGLAPDAAPEWTPGEYRTAGTRMLWLNNVPVDLRVA